MNRSILMRAERAVRKGQFQKIFILCLLVSSLLATVAIGVIVCAVIIVLRSF